MSRPRTCMMCGCTEATACVDRRGACCWVGPKLCSHCRDSFASLLAVTEGNAFSGAAPVTITLQDALQLRKMLAWQMKP